MSAVHSPRHRNLARYYHWELSDRNLRIYLDAAMVDRLQADVLTGLAFPAGPRETGGILLGYCEPDGETTNTFVEDFLPVPTAYTGGPLYAPSDHDILNFEAALLRAALAACDSDSPPVLGYYRSHARDALSLGAEDLALIEGYFTEPTSVFMLVKAVRNAKASTAGFFFWEDGRIESEFSSFEVALGRMKATPGDLTREPVAEASGEAYMCQKAAETIPPLSSLEESAPPAAPVTLAPPLPGSPRTTRSAWPGLVLRFAVIVLATAVLVVSAIRYLGAPRQPQQNVTASTVSAGLLGFEVEQRSAGLDIIWNQSAPAVANAVGGVLSIQDAGGSRSLPLDKVMLATGHVLYTPAGDDIQFRLEVWDAEQRPTAQSLRVLMPAGRRQLAP